MKCPKCNHIRSANETAPKWQCPSCGMAYSKYKKENISNRKQPKKKRLSGGELIFYGLCGLIFIQFKYSIGDMNLASGGRPYQAPVTSEQNPLLYAYIYYSAMTIAIGSIVVGFIRILKK